MKTITLKEIADYLDEPMRCHRRADSQSLKEAFYADDYPVIEFPDGQVRTFNELFAILKIETRAELLRHQQDYMNYALTVGDNENMEVFRGYLNDIMDKSYHYHAKHPELTLFTKLIRDDNYQIVQEERALNNCNIAYLIRKYLHIVPTI